MALGSRVRKYKDEKQAKQHNQGCRTRQAKLKGKLVRDVSPDNSNKIEVSHIAKKMPKTQDPTD